MDPEPGVVLIIDDTPENLRVLGELLENDGHEVRVATSGPHGLEIAKTSSVDLVLLDIMMPDMDGYEVCKMLKADKATQSIPVIFLTALDSSEDEAQGLNLGAVDFITKPFKIELVRARIGNQLALQAARKELKHQNERLEELVAERTQELAEAHRRLLAVDSAKYDFLQLIYLELWAPETGMIELSRKALSRLGPSAVLAGWVQEYEKSQAALLETMNNALLMAGTHRGDHPGPAHPIRLEVLVTEIQSQFGPLAATRKLRFRGSIDSSLTVSGDLDLLFQALTTVVHAAILLAREGSTVQVKAEDNKKTVALELVFQANSRDDGVTTLFQPEVDHHRSAIRRELGLGVPLAAKIVGAAGGSIAVEEHGRAGVVLRVTLLSFLKNKGARIVL